MSELVKSPKKRFRFNVYQKISLGFLSVILIGTLLLSLPVSHAPGVHVTVHEAAFSSVSAVCVTGLSIIEIGTDLSFFGQLVMMLLIQVGGLGFMTATALIFLALGKRISLSERLALQESLNESQLEGVVRMTRNAIKITFAIEGTGAVLLLYPMISRFGFWDGLWKSIFHAVSSFCNAGFDLLGQGNSLGSVYDDPIIMFVTMALIVLGGLGFLVIMDVGRFARRKKRLSLQSKIVLISTALLIIVGAIIFIAAEGDNPETMGSWTIGEKIMGGLFQSVTCRTAGFASFPQENMQTISSFVSILLMFIGASPAGTGGGIKTTTMAVLVALTMQIIRGRSETVMFKRTINRSLVLRAIGVAILSIILVLVVTLVISMIEADRHDSHNIMFETVSAFATVGLTQALTPNLLPASQIVLMVTMFAGRVGMMSLMLALTKQFAKNKGDIHYPEEKIMIG